MHLSECKLHVHTWSHMNMPPSCVSSCAWLQYALVSVHVHLERLCTCGVHVEIMCICVTLCVCVYIYIIDTAKVRTHVCCVHEHLWNDARTYMHIQNQRNFRTTTYDLKLMLALSF